MRVGHRPGGHGPPDHQAGEIVVFPTGRTLARVDDRPGDAVSDDPVPAAVVDRSTDPDPPRHYHARPGPRPGRTPGTTSARAGGDTDIVRSLLVTPGTASRIVLAGGVFELPLPYLRIRTDRVDARFLVWAAEIVAEREAPVPVTLHLLGSPSMVVTVLELVPCRRVRWGRDRFVRRGVEAVEALARRIEQAA